jgi:hypothetical protein
MFIAPAIWLFVMTGRTRDDVEEALSTAAAKAAVEWPLAQAKSHERQRLKPTKRQLRGRAPRYYQAVASTTEIEARS